MMGISPTDMIRRYVSPSTPKMMTLLAVTEARRAQRHRVQDPVEVGGSAAMARRISRVAACSSARVARSD